MGRSGWWIPPIVCGAGGRWEEGRVVFFSSCQVFWDGVSSKCQALDPPTDGALRADYMQSHSTFTWGLYLNTVFWISALLEIFWETFLKVSLRYISKTSTVLLAPLHVFGFFWWLLSLLSRALKSAGDFVGSLKRQTATRFVPRRRKTSGCGRFDVKEKMCQTLQNPSLVLKDWMDHMNNMIVYEWMNERTNVEIKSAVLNVPNAIKK